MADTQDAIDAAGEEPPGAGVDDDGEDAVGELDLEAAEEGDDADDGQLFDYSALCLKEDHGNRPLWVCPNGSVFLETYSPIYKQAYDFLITVAEPKCRPEALHEYLLSQHSLYAAVSIGLQTDAIISVLNRLSKVELSPQLCQFIKDSTENFGKVKLVLDQSRFYVESPHHDILDSLMADDVIKAAVIHDTSSGLRTRRTLLDDAVYDLAMTGMKEDRGEPPPALPARHAPPADDPDYLLMGEGEEGEGEEPLDEEMEAAFGHDAPRPSQAAPSAAATSAAATSATAGARQPAARGSAAAALPAGPSGALNPRVAEGMAALTATLGTPGVGQAGVASLEQDKVYSFEVRPDLVERVKERCLPAGLNYPMLEEYDFRNDAANADVPNFDLKPTVRHRPYQEKSLAKMFGNSRARSGIVVLPCGAGKSLVGISAAQRIRKSCLCLVTNAVSVDQWQNEFKRWSTLEDQQIMRFTAQVREQLPQSGRLDVCITTYNMVAYTGRRSEQSKQIMQAIASQEWGLLLMDEVHVVPATMFRKVVGVIKSHCKLGLTATLVREDSLIKDLNFLIGPKLYEANWLDLARDGHIANVQSNEVWCPMQSEFFREYLKPDNASLRQLLYVLNPNKFQACQWLMEYHERIRGDKIIVFSDNLFALREYATRLRRPFICGATSHADRTRILYNFKNNPQVNTVFLSKVGDNSIDVPDANVLLQISSHAGSRRQEAQRLGRILRAKRVRQGADATQHNAFFYTLVSQDTQEMYYSTKRQQFLVDQGYAFKVVTNLLDGAAAAQLQLSTRNEQLNLLAKILSTAVEDAQEEEEQAPNAGRAGASAGNAPRAKARRVATSLSTMSGAAGRMYMEYSTK